MFNMINFLISPSFRHLQSSNPWRPHSIGSHSNMLQQIIH